MRWRDVKKGIKKQANDCNDTKISPKKAPFYLSQRIIAFITDMFMINMPILYIATYVVLGSKEAFVENQGVIFVCGLLFGIILSIMFSLSGQSLGYRYVRLKLIRDNPQAQNTQQDNASVDSAPSAQEVPSFFVAFLRYVLWIVSVVSIFGILVALVRSDSKALYDIVCRTKVIAMSELPQAKQT